MSKSLKESKYLAESEPTSPKDAAHEACGLPQCYIHCCHGILIFAYSWFMLFFIYGKNKIKKPCTYLEGFEPLTSCFVRLRGECFTAVQQPLPHYSSFCLSRVTKLFNIKMGRSWSLFLYFRLLYLNELVAKILPIPGFEAGISGVGTNSSTN